MDRCVTHVVTCTNIQDILNIFESSYTLFRPAKESKRKTAFTLAEVLITLGIIGVVAALTLPSVINNTQKKEIQEGLKKAYSTLQQALLMYQNDTGETPTRQSFITKAGSLKTSLFPYFTGGYDCGNGSEETACIKLINSVTNNPYRNFSNNAQVNAIYFDDGQFILSDGMMYFFENNDNGDSAVTFIHVDVNGIKKRPNQWGRDLFTFEPHMSFPLLQLSYCCS